MDEFPDPADRYLLDECLACGAYAKVYTATDSQAGNKKVAIKTQAITATNEKFLLQECEVLRELHANLPDFYGVYRKDESVWFVMEVKHPSSYLPQCFQKCIERPVKNGQ